MTGTSDLDRFTGGTGCGSWEVMCPNTTFHASRDTARAYLTSHSNLDAQVLDQDTAIDHGRYNFGSLLNDDPR